MSKQHLTNALYRRLQGGPCPVCDKWFEPNGTGNEGAKFTHWVLARMPWDDILQLEAVPMHDWRCHIGAYEYNTTFEETTQEFKDNIENAINVWCKAPWMWHRRPLRAICFQYIDEVYAYAVSKTSAGKEAYDSNTCMFPDE